MVMSAVFGDLSGWFAGDNRSGGRAAHLWVIKPYGEPILLCADGTVKHMMRIGVNVIFVESWSRLLT